MPHRLLAASLCGILLACANVRPPDSSTSSPSRSTATADPRPELPGCDSTYRERDLIPREPFVARYPATADGSTAPDTVLAGRGARLCGPRDIAIGPAGDLYVLNASHSNARDSSGRPVGWRTWVMVYGPGARGNAAPARSFSVRESSGLEVDSSGHVWLSGGGPGALDAGSVTVYAPDADGNAAPLRTIAGPRTGLRRPVGLAIDRRGHLHVINEQRNVHETDDTVRIFAREAGGDVTPDRVIAGQHTRLFGPRGLGFDRKGRLYVGNMIHPQLAPPHIVVYPPDAAGDVAPVRTIRSQRLFPFWPNPPRQLAIDSHDTLRAAYSHHFNAVFVFSPGVNGEVEPTRRDLVGDEPFRFAVDRHDTLYLLRNDSVAVYAPGAGLASTPVRTIAGPRTGLPAARRATSMALDAEGRLHVADGASPPAILVYPAGAGGDVAPVRTIAGNRTRLHQPQEIAVDRRGYLYVTNGSQPGGGGIVRVYGPEARGQAEPARVIAGPETAMARPIGIGRDSRGNIYVTSESETGGKVAVYGPRAYDNEPPLRTIGGPETLLRRPIGLAIGPGDSLYVLNAFGYWRCSMMAPREVTVTVYPPGASGNVEPARHIVVTQAGRSAGGQASLTRPRGLTVDRAGAVYISFEVPGRVAVFAPGADGAIAPVRTLQMDGTHAAPAALAIGEDGALYVVGFPYPMAC